MGPRQFRKVCRHAAMLVPPATEEIKQASAGKRGAYGLPQPGGACFREGCLKAFTSLYLCESGVDKRQCKSPNSVFIQVVHEIVVENMSAPSRVTQPYIEDSDTHRS